MNYEGNVEETQCFVLEVAINLVVSSFKVANLQQHVTPVHSCKIFSLVEVLQCT